MSEYLFTSESVSEGGAGELRFRISQSGDRGDEAAGAGNPGKRDGRGDERGHADAGDQYAGGEKQVEPLSSSPADFRGPVCRECIESNPQSPISLSPSCQGRTSTRPIFRRSAPK